MATSESSVGLSVARQSSRGRFGAGLGASALAQRCEQMRASLMTSSFIAGGKDLREGLIRGNWTGVPGSSDGNPSKGMPDDLLLVSRLTYLRVANCLIVFLVLMDLGSIRYYW